MKTTLPRAPRFGIRTLLAALPLVAGAATLIGFRGTARSDDAAAEVKAKNERCAVRLSAALIGQSTAAELALSADPQAEVDRMLASPAFIERFASFMNSMSNNAPAADPNDDVVYHLSKYILANGKPWSELYNGEYKIVGGAVSADPNGLGYFRNAAWLTRYRGNETSGLKLVTANRIQHNVVGLRVSPTTNLTGIDPTATGREASSCRGCHYDNWFALDKVAAVLTRYNKSTQSFDPPPSNATPQTLYGTSVSNDKDIVNALIKSENFSFNVCRNAFTYMFGRAENTCDGELFDRCIDAFKAKGTMQAAVAVIAKDKGFCQ